MEQHVEKLIEEAAKAAGFGNHVTAMNYAQAALHAAQALAQLEAVRQLKANRPSTSA